MLPQSTNGATSTPSTYFDSSRPPAIDDSLKNKSYVTENYKF